MPSTEEENPQVELLPRHISGLWLGECVPDVSLGSTVPVNPIRWSLSIMNKQAIDTEIAGPYPVFGAGYFDDSGDIPNNPILFYLLKGDFDPINRKVAFRKVYDIGPNMYVQYEGDVIIRRGEQPIIKGKWHNSFEGTHGAFAARLEQ